MFLAIWALVYLGVECAIDYNTDTVNYVQDLRDVDEARKLLDLHIINKEYSVVDPDLQYLVMVGVVRKTAKSLIKTSNAPQDVNSTQLLLHYLQKYPRFLSTPRKVVRKVQRLRDLTLIKLQPLVFYVKYVCGSLKDSECNKKIDSEVQEDPELQNSVTALSLATDAARSLLAINPGMVEAAKYLNVMSYLMENLEEVVELAEAVARLMEEVDP